MNILRESMTKFIIANQTIRVWREEPEHFQKEYNSDLFPAANDLSHKGFSGAQLADQLLALPRVNAVEVLDSMGNGRIAYRDWP